MFIFGFVLSIIQAHLILTLPLGLNAKIVLLSSAIFQIFFFWKMIKINRITTENQTSSSEHTTAIYSLRNKMKKLETRVEELEKAKNNDNDNT